MKFFLIVSTLLTISAPVFSKTITVNGLRAKALINIASELNSTDGAMGGRLFAELKNVHCEKTVDDKNWVYLQSCSFDAFEHVEVNSQGEENRHVAEELRAALIDIAQNEKKTSTITKTIDVKTISCKAIGLGHALDDLDLEPRFSCTLWL